MISAKIICDSINSYGCRLTTFILEYPRFVHAELMTHRVFSKNSASSRAIPISKMIRDVIDNPAVPVWWGKSQKGMQAKEELSGLKQSLCKFIWFKFRYLSCGLAWLLDKLGLHKQISNRILEPWFNMRVILSGTEFKNFFALRAHPDAQPEIRTLAEKMLHEYNLNTPVELKDGEWHIPFVEDISDKKLYSISAALNKDEGDVKKLISIARCARVSYLNFDGTSNPMKDVALCERLFGSVPKHLSPTEHVAQAKDSREFFGNFRGFKQYRKFIPDETYDN